MNGAAPSVLANANLVKKVVFPLEILPVIHLASAVVLGASWFLLLFAGAAVLDISFHPSALLLPLLLLPVLLLALGVAFFVAASTVFVRDMPHLTAVLIQILFFMTPIFYSIDMIPASLRWLMALNPLASMVDQVRNALLFGQWPDWGTFAWNMGLAFIVCRLGVCWFLKTKKGFADVL